MKSILRLKVRRLPVLFFILIDVFILSSIASCAPAPICKSAHFVTISGLIQGLVQGLVLSVAVLENMQGTGEYGLYDLQNVGFIYWIG